MNASAAHIDNAIKHRFEAALDKSSNDEQLLPEIVAICSRDPDASWEVLALVDQYFRRGRLSNEVFRTVKFQVQRLALGQPVATTPEREPPAATRPAPAAPTVLTAPTAPAPPTIRVGSVLRERYVLEAPIDYGNPDVVYRALDRYRADLPLDEQRVAVRFPKHSGDAGREFFRAQSLTHPNIARVFDLEREGELAYYTLELLPGKLLRDVLEELPSLPLPVEQALTIVREVGTAIVYAHEQNVAHGALDSRSVMITASGGVRVLNFGSLHADARLPEQRDDLTALACLAYELLDGKHPFQRHSAVVARQLGLRAKRPSGLNRRQWRGLQRGLAWSRKNRVLSVKEWLPELELHRAAATLPPLAEMLATTPRHPWSKTAIAAVAAASVATTLALVTMIDPQGVRTSYDTLRAATTSVATNARPPTPPPANSAARAPDAAMAPGVNDQALAPSAVAGAAPPPDQSPGRISFASQYFTVPQNAAAASIVVRRSDGLQGDVGFSWWTASGSAKSGEDFISLGLKRESIPDGEDSVTLFVPLVSTPSTPGRTQFYVSIGNPTGGARLGDIARVIVILERQ